MSASGVRTIGKRTPEALIGIQRSLPFNDRIAEKGELKSVLKSNERCRYRQEGLAPPPLQAILQDPQLSAKGLAGLSWAELYHIVLELERRYELQNRDHFDHELDLMRRLSKYNPTKWQDSVRGWEQLQYYAPPCLAE